MKRTIDLQKREHEKNIKLKTYAEEALKSKVEELEKSLNDKNKKLNKEKEVNNNLIIKLFLKRGGSNAEEITSLK